MKKFLILLSLPIWFVHCAHKSTSGDTAVTPSQAPMFKYNELMLKDYDEMNELVRKGVQKARAAGAGSEDELSDEALDELTQTLKLIVSRPNSDNMVVKLTPDVRRELGAYQKYDDVVAALVNEAMGVIANPNKTGSQQATAIFMLENLLSEIRPEVGGSPQMRQIVERVAAARLTIPKDALNDLQLKGMFRPRNPSEVAQEILREYQPKKKK